MKNNKIIQFCLILTMFLSVQAFAQTASVSNVMNFKSAKQNGTILEHNKIVGYYIFYFKEKSDKKNSTYEVELFDDNYNSVSSFELTRPKNTVMLETVYNGEVFMFFFYDRKQGYEFVTYNREGVKKGTKKTPVKEIPKWDLQNMMTAQQAGTENTTIYPLGNKGFVRQSYTKNKKVGYNLVAMDNDLKVLWNYGSDETSKLIETIDISEVTEELVTATISRRKGAMTKRMDQSFLVLNVETGKKLAELELGNDETGKKSVLNAFIEKESGKITLIGEYYKPGDDILKDKSQGIYMQEIDNGGGVLKAKEYAWKGDIDKFKQQNLDEEDKKEAKSNFSIFFHDAIKAKNGHLFLIGEQYRKQISAGAVAAKMLVRAAGGTASASSFEVRVGNMIVIELDENSNLVDFDIINKKKTSVWLPEGAGMWNSSYLGYYISITGGFDYSFTSRETENDKFSVVYTDYNRKEEKDSKKSDVMLGVITIEAGKQKAERVPINTDAKTWWLRAAKPGYISIGEYFRKEKKVTMRLEQLTY